VLTKYCNNCYGHGWVYNYAILLNPANWIPFNWPKDMFIQCPSCKGRGYFHVELKVRPRWRGW
jgi:hypothetical protein